MHVLEKRYYQNKTQLCYNFGSVYIFQNKYLVFSIFFHLNYILYFHRFDLFIFYPDFCNDYAMYTKTAVKCISVVIDKSDVNT